MIWNLAHEFGRTLSSRDPVVDLSFLVHWRIISTFLPLLIWEILAFCIPSIFKRKHMPKNLFHSWQLLTPSRLAVFSLLLGLWWILPWNFLPNVPVVSIISFLILFIYFFAFAPPFALCLYDLIIELCMGMKDMVLNVPPYFEQYRRFSSSSRPIADPIRRVFSLDFSDKFPLDTASFLCSPESKIV